MQEHELPLIEQIIAVANGNPLLLRAAAEINLLTEINRRLRVQLKDARQDIRDLKAELKAEQMSHSIEQSRTY